MPATNPPARSTHAMASDDVRGRVIMFGGLNVSDTWEWDGTNWLLRSSSGPAPRSNHAMAFDQLLGRTVLFGGSGSTPSGLFSDTWEWDGNAWLQGSTSVRPYERTGHAMAFDPVRGRTLLFGGYDSETWIYGSTAALASAYGMACTGTHGRPLLTPFGTPRIGESGFAGDMVSVLPSTAVLFGFSTARGNVALGGGCTLYVASPFLLIGTASNASGFATLYLSVPKDLGLRGLNVCTQGFSIDPNGAFFGLLAMSTGLEIRLGD
jgi:hypothetical protein